MARIVGLPIWLFPDTVTAKEILTRDEYGNADTYGDERDLRGRVVMGDVKVARQRDGVEMTSTCHVVFAGSFDLSTDYQYTLPARYLMDTPEPIAVKRVSDESGPYYEVVYFGGNR